MHQFGEAIGLVVHAGSVIVRDGRGVAFGPSPSRAQRAQTRALEYWYSTRYWYQYCNK